MAQLTKRGLVLAYLLVQLAVSTGLLGVAFLAEARAASSSGLLELVIGALVGYWLRESVHIGRVIAGNGDPWPEETA